VSAGLRIALAQLAGVEGDTTHNLETARRAVDEAARLEADCVVLPELHLTGFVGADQLPRIAEPWPGRTLAGHDGRILSTYRKTHLFAAERRLYTPGNALTDPADLVGVATGILVCYDVEFPEAARRLALAGAECILVPSANMDPWGPRHRVFATARALENHLFVAYCNRCGEGPGMTYPGESAIIDPMGNVLCEAGADETVVCADLDLGAITESTKVFDYREERRPDLYDAPGADAPGD
jgi:(R)-amidase